MYVHQKRWKLLSINHTKKKSHYFPSLQYVCVCVCFSPCSTQFQIVNINLQTYSARQAWNSVKYEKRGRIKGGNIRENPGRAFGIWFSSTGRQTCFFLRMELGHANFSRHKFAACTLASNTMPDLIELEYINKRCVDNDTFPSLRRLLHTLVVQYLSHLIITESCDDKFAAKNEAEIGTRKIWEMNAVQRIHASRKISPQIYRIAMCGSTLFIDFEKLQLSVHREIPSRRARKSHCGCSRHSRPRSWQRKQNRHTANPYDKLRLS